MNTPNGYNAELPYGASEIAVDNAGRVWYHTAAGAGWETERSYHLFNRHGSGEMRFWRAEHTLPSVAVNRADEARAVDDEPAMVGGRVMNVRGLLAYLHGRLSAGTVEKWAYCVVSLAPGARLKSRTVYPEGRACRAASEWRQWVNWGGVTLTPEGYIYSNSLAQKENMSHGTENHR